MGEKARSEATGYYSTMTASERSTFDSGRSTEVSQLESTLAAAWLSSNAPTAGQAGSSCATDVCTNAAHCCGTSTPKTGAYVTATLNDVCVDSTSLLYTDGLGRQYDHVCSSFAQKILATASAARVAFYSIA